MSKRIGVKRDPRLTSVDNISEAFGAEVDFSDVTEIAERTWILNTRKPTGVASSGSVSMEDTEKGPSIEENGYDFEDPDFQAFINSERLRELGGPFWDFREGDKLNVLYLGVPGEDNLKEIDPVEGVLQGAERYPPNMPSPLESGFDRGEIIVRDDRGGHLKDGKPSSFTLVESEYDFRDESVEEKLEDLYGEDLPFDAKKAVEMLNQDYDEFSYHPCFEFLVY